MTRTGAAWAAFGVAMAAACAFSVATAPGRALSDDERVARAIVHATRHEPGAALDDLAVVLDHNPRHPQAHYAAALVATSEGRRADALRHTRAYLMLAPNAPDAAQARAALRTLEQEEKTR